MKAEGHQLKVLLLDAATGFYRMQRYRVGDFFGPVDLGIHLAYRHNGLNIGAGLLAGSVFPGSNRLVFSGISPCWHGFFVSSMGGAALVFDNLGINLLTVIGKAPKPSILYLNRNHGEEIEVELLPVTPERVWEQGRKGVYAVMEEALARFGPRYEKDPRVLAAGPASLFTDFGAIASAPIKSGALTAVDTWAGRGGFGTKLLQEHGLLGIIYGGTHLDEDVCEHSVADEWFQDKFNQRMAAKDLEATTKYRYDPHFNTGGTFGVNYAAMEGRLLAFNYRTIFWSEAERRDLHRRFILDLFVHNAFARQGWMVPNQYWTPGTLAPMAITGKYYMHYGPEFLPPRELGRENARRMVQELLLDNLGICRFHRAWAEDLMPDIVEKIFGCRDAFLNSLRLTASRITSRNASIFWESERNADLVKYFLQRKKEVDGLDHPDLAQWIELFDRDPSGAAYEFWYEMHKGIQESFREFPV